MNWIDTIHSRPVGKSFRLVLADMIFAAPKRMVVSLVREILNWHRDLVERQQLRDMSEHVLKDVGLTRGQADQMANQPWPRRDIRKTR